MTLLVKQNATVVDRRAVLKNGLIGGLGLAALSGLSSPATAALSDIGGGTRVLSFHNVHTGEKFKGEYKVGSHYLPDAFEEINHVLRDFRTGEEFPMDPRVMDIMYSLYVQTGSQHNFEILSGYRSPKTNNMLRRSSTGVAKNSFHMTGQAVDLRMPGVSTRDLRKIALGLRAGGVGYYSKSNFLHVDTGNVRSW